MRTETIGSCTLYPGDAKDVLPTLPRVDALVCDPPYGIGEGEKAGRRTASFTGNAKWRSGRPTDYEASAWDAETADDVVAMAVDKARWSIVFGGNYYTLPPTSCWLIWDKLNGDSDFADCEMAWTNMPKAVRRIRFLWNGFQRGEQTERWHPTQKPVGVMKWCIEHIPTPNTTILDPFMGSGTTGVACVKLGRSFIGIEREPKYFDIACRRIEAAYKQPDLFIASPSPKPVQEALL